MFDFLAKIDDHFISTFSDDRNPVIFKINILDIKSHTFWYTDSGTKEQCDNRQIPVFSLFIVNFFLSGELDVYKRQYVQFDAPLPEYFEELLKKLRKQTGN